MPSLERFFDPQMRKFDANVRPLPGARLYFFESGTTTPKTTYQDKQGEDAHTNPVIADSTGVFPQIFLDGLYRVELRSSSNIVQPGWPIDNIGQDTPVVPFGPWIEINTYNEGEVVTGSNGNWYRSITDNNLGNDPISSPSEWEVIPIPVASSFTSNKAYLTWDDDGDQVSLNVDTDGLIDEIEANLDQIDGNLTVDGNAVFNNPVRIGSGTYVNDQSEISSDGIDYYPIVSELNFSSSTLNTLSAAPSGNLVSATLRYWRVNNAVFGLFHIESSGIVADPPDIGILPLVDRPEQDIRMFVAGSGGAILTINASTGLVETIIPESVEADVSVFWITA